MACTSAWASSFCPLQLLANQGLSPNYSQELVAFAQVIEEAEPIAMSFFRKNQAGGNIGVSYKAGDPSDPLSMADLELNELIISRMKSQFGKDLFVGEESARAVSQDDLNRHSRVWYLDPIDGTKHFIEGNAGWTIQMGLVENGIPVFGIVYQPVTGLLWFAEKGAGAYEFDVTSGSLRSIHRPSENSRQIPNLITVGSSSGGLDGEIADVFEKLRIDPDSRFDPGSVGLKVIALIKDQADLYFADFRKSGRWDTTAPHVIAVEAGLSVLQMDPAGRLQWEAKPFDYSQKGDEFRNDFSFAIGPESVLRALQQ
ncbi:MAG: inositol monophosphatase family protein [Pseudomonadota bacterium]